jgi:hypothetical protein
MRSPTIVPFLRPFLAAALIFLGIVPGRADTWSSQDIGSVGLPGTADYSSVTNTYTLAGSGSDVSGTSDGFFYLWVNLRGDCDVIARVTDVENTNSAAKAGIMLREGLLPGSRHVTVAVTPQEGVQTMYRTDTGGATSYISGGSVSAPYI